MNPVEISGFNILYKKLTSIYKYYDYTNLMDIHKYIHKYIDTPKYIYK